MKNKLLVPSTLLVGVIALAGCQSGLTNAAAPSPLGSLAAESTAAKPSANLAFATTFQDEVVGSGTLTGSKSGSDAGNLKVSASGTYTLTVVDKPDESEPYPCTGQLLVGSPLTGALSLSIDQARASMTFSLKNIAGFAGWQVNGNTIVGHGFGIDEAGGVITLMAERFRLTFNPPPSGTGTLFGCRADFILTMSAS